MIRSTSTKIPLLSGLIALLAMPTAQAADAPVVQTDKGAVKGIEAENGTWAYLGIPFAAPPTAFNRWKAPQEAEAWSGVFNANRKPTPCLQRGLTGTIGSEDCLYLNIWRPQAPSDEPRPVMVWIHGGGNIMGSNGSPIYDGQNIAEKGDVILVSLQYRLGFTGFFNHPALHTGNDFDDSGNYALLDQMKALEWVQENITAFGGDADRVTIFGESAGGMNSWSLMVSDQADGLFHNAIIESGCPTFIPKDVAQNNAHNAVRSMAIDDGYGSEETIDAFLAQQGESWIQEYLYQKPADEMLLQLADSGAIDMTLYYGIEDGFILPQNALEAVETGSYTGVPAIIGSNRDEAKLFFSMFYGMGPMSYNKAMNTLYGDDRDDVEDLYPASDYAEGDHYSRFTDTSDWYLELACGTQGALLAAPHHPVWNYKFHYDQLEPPFDDQIGASHFMEVPVIFDHYNASIYAQGSEADFRSLSDKMLASWTCLARTGDPNGCADSVPWPRLHATGDQALERMVWDVPESIQTIDAKEMEKVDYWWNEHGIDLYNGRQSSPIYGAENMQDTLDFVQTSHPGSRR